MFRLKSGYRMLTNNLPSNIIAVLVIGLSMLAVNFCVNYIKGFYTPAKMLEPLLGGYVCEINSAEFDAGNLAGLESISYGYTAFGLTGGKQVEINAYDKPLADLARVRLKAGSWYGDTENADGEFNAVATENSGFEPGDLLTAAIGIDAETVQLRITGILPNSFYLYRLSGLAMPASSSSAVCPYPSVDAVNNTPLVLTDCRAVEKYRDSYVGYLRFDADISGAQLAQNLDYIKIYGDYASVAELEANSYKLASEASQLFIPMVVLLALLAVIGTAAVIGITVIQNKKMLTLLFYCGAKRRDITEIIGLYITTVFAFATTVFAVANLIINSLFAKSGTYMPDRVSFWCVLLITYVVILCAAMLLGNNSNKNISVTIKEE